MAWPDTADFPENWEGLIGYDGTDYTGTWVLDTTVVPPGKAASLRTNPGPNGWCAIKTPLFTYQNAVGGTWSGSVKFQWRQSAVRDSNQPVRFAVFREDGVLVESNATGFESFAANEWHDLTFLFSNTRMVHGERYFVVLCARFPDIDYWISGFQLQESLGAVPPYTVNYDFDADTADIIRTPAPALPNAGDLDAWPGPLDPYYGLPEGWVIDYPQFFVDMGEPWLNAVPNPIVGSNGAGVSLPLAFTAKFANEALNNIAPGVYHGTDLWAVSPEAPAESVVSFDYLNGMEVDIYTSTGLPFTYDDSTQIDEILDVNATGWKRATYTVGDQPAHFIIFQRSRDAPLIYSLFGPYYASAIDNFVIQPLTVSDGDAADEVGMVVGGVFRWEPTVIVEDSAAAAESVMGVPYAGWLTDPEWPIWHAGSPTYLPPTDPGTAWDFLDDVAYADQDYGVGVSGTIVIRASANLTDAGVITDELDAPNEPMLEGRAIAFDQHEPLARTSTLAADAEGDELPTISMTMALTAESVGAASDEAQQSASATMEDSASADDDTFTSWQALATDAATATDEVEVGMVATTSAESEGVADELVAVVSGPLAVDDAAGVDELFADMLLSALSEAEASDELITANELDLGMLVSEAAADDLMTVATVRNAELADEAVAESAPLFAMPGAIAWVMNTETTAVSWYSNWQFTDMVQAGDKLLAVGPEGLSVIGGNTDAGAAITARVEYDFNEFGGYDREGAPLSSEYKKRVENFWVGYCSPGRLRFVVETYGQGYGPQTYNLEQRPANEPRNSRVKIGRGLNSRWWKVVLTNVSGAAFEVTSLSADVAQNTRRA